MKKSKQTLLWNISHPNIEGDSYVFGTMHVSDERAFSYEKLVTEKIQDCDAFALEFNLETAEMNISAEAMNLPDGMTLSEMIPPKKYKKINNRFRRMTGYDLGMFNRSLPMQITNMMAELVLSNDRLKSLDESLFLFAKEEGKILLGIETFEEQIEIMKKISVKNQLQGMLRVFRNFKKFRKSVLGLTELYVQGNIQKLYKSTKKSAGKERKFLLYDRNEIMAERISKMTREQTIVCAIGAAHLAGNKGVLRLLKSKGMKVKPVNN